MKDTEYLKRKLCSIQEIEFNEPHMTLRLEQRGVEGKHIISNLRNPSNLEKVVDMGERENGRKKYKLYFKISNKRTLWVMVLINSKIKVLTTNYLTRKWQKTIERGGYYGS